MGMNKQVRISVPLTVTISDKGIEEFTEDLIEMTHDFVNGVELEPFKKHLVLTAYNHGVEAAVEAVIRLGVTDMLREELHNKSKGDDAVRYRIAPPVFNWKK